MRLTKGFTLIEVLIALVIMAIALTAIIKTTVSATHDLQYVEDKNISHWVALNILDQVKAELITTVPSQGQMKMANKEWQWSLKKKMIKKNNLITVDVMQNDQNYSQLSTLIPLKNIDNAQN